MYELCFMSYMSSREAAAWMQAALTVAVIIVAIRGPLVQHRRERKADAEKQNAEEKRKLKVIEMVMMHVSAAIVTAADVLIGAPSKTQLTVDLKVHKDIMSDVNRMAGAVQLHDLPSPEILRNAFQLINTGSQMEDYLGRFHSNLAASTFDFADAKSVGETQRAKAQKNIAAFTDAVAAFLAHEI